MKKTLVAVLCLSFLTISPACSRQNDTPPGEIKTYRNGELRLLSADEQKSVYVDAADLERPEGVASLKAALARDGFVIAASPSEASYILRVSVMGTGAVDPVIFASLVNAGYGGSAKFSGEGAVGALADVLLVRREAPEHPRPSRARLKNAANRNALESSQARVGALREDGDPAKNDFSLFADAIAGELKAALSVENALEEGKD